MSDDEREMDVKEREEEERPFTLVHKTIKSTVNVSIILIH